VAVRCMPLLQRIAGKKEAEGEKQGLQEQERFFFFLEQRSFWSALGFSSVFPACEFYGWQEPETSGREFFFELPLGLEDDGVYHHTRNDVSVFQLKHGPKGQQSYSYRYDDNPASDFSIRGTSSNCFQVGLLLIYMIFLGVNFYQISVLFYFFHRQNGPNSTNLKKFFESSNVYDYSRR
jgi:hypothetical protein